MVFFDNTFGFINQSKKAHSNNIEDPNQSPPIDFQKYSQ